MRSRGVEGEDEGRGPGRHQHHLDQERREAAARCGSHGGGRVHTVIGEG